MTFQNFLLTITNKWIIYHFVHYPRMNLTNMEITKSPLPDHLLKNDFEIVEKKYNLDNIFFR